jgi:SAM-dependent methyltransferase
LPPELSETERWQKYLQFDGSALPFADQSIDVALFCDVLHHMPPDVQARMLQEAARVAKHIVIKDHFEYGLWSRTWLRAMDFVGNWAYGVTVPKRYFDCTSFATITEQVGLKYRSLDVGIDLYRHIPIARHLLQKKWQFIAVMIQKT